MKGELNNWLIALVILTGCYFIWFGTPDSSDAYYYDVKQSYDAVVLDKKDEVPKKVRRSRRIKSFKLPFEDYWHREYTIKYIILFDEDKQALNDAIHRIGWNNLFQDTKNNGRLTDIYNILPDRVISKKVSKELYDDTPVGSVTKVYLNEAISDVKPVLEKEHPMKYKDKLSFYYYSALLALYGAFRIPYRLVRTHASKRKSA